MAPTIKLKKGTRLAEVFKVLKDRKWHCRSHDYHHVPSDQLAGGGGIQGLKRGTSSRPGLRIESRREVCKRCERRTRQDRWTGELQKATAASSFPRGLKNRILSYFKQIDSVELRKRSDHELIIDHRFPMLRWGEVEESLSSGMSDRDIASKFQLLKADGSGNHNLLKSRACEACFKTGKRGQPFGIGFFYKGRAAWPKSVPATGTLAEKGCVGCGWYDFDKWRDALNAHLRRR